ncbi:hypothetical protein [Kordiimonas sp.]|uniref:hypothetical protein n=1 Tax=Kordiimonas sp. TaxID=1970157 RepID=UPI003A93E971
MTRWNRMAGFLVSVLFLGASVSAQPAELPTPDQLFMAAEEHHGWDKLKAGITTVEAQASVRTGERTYKTLVRGRATDEGLSDATFEMTEDDGTVTYGEADGAIWYEGKDGNRRDLAPVMAAYVRGHQFHRRALFPRQELKVIDDTVEEVEFNGIRAFKVSGTTHSGASLAYFFDERDSAMLGYHLTVQEPDGPHPMDFILKDWRTSADQSIFWRIDINDRGTLYVYTFNKILLLP